MNESIISEMNPLETQVITDSGEEYTVKTDLIMRHYKITQYKQDQLESKLLAGAKLAVKIRGQEIVEVK